MFRPRRILVPVDLSPGHEPVVRAGADMAREFGGRLLLFHCFDSRTVEDVYNLHGLKEGEVRERMRANAESVLARVRKKTWLRDLKVEVRYGSGLPPEEIVAAARDWKADLVVLRRRRRGGLAHLLFGRTSDGVVREAHCSVLVLA